MPEAGFPAPRPVTLGAGSGSAASDLRPSGGSPTIVRMEASERLLIRRDQTTLVGERWGEGAPVVVLLHSGVTDRRGWYGVIEHLRAAPTAGTLVAYDRRGSGETPAATCRFSDLEDLRAVLEQVTGAPSWLVGSSRGGRLALDAALTDPASVAGLVLLAPAASGSPPLVDVDTGTARLDRLITQAREAADWKDANRLETWLWLDGPAGPEGRVGGAARELAMAMNAVILASPGEHESDEDGTGAWDRLADLTAPTTVACGDREIPALMVRSRELARRIPHARHVQLPGMAHLPYLEQPAAIAELLREAIFAQPSPSVL